jgi:DNA-binding response OmpR family regulator
MPYGCRVLLIEDEKAIRLPVARVLSQSGYVTITPGEGLEALRLKLGPLPCLIILNTASPKSGGTRWLGIVRADPRTAGLPVITISSQAAPKRLEGVDIALGRPLEAVALIAAVEVACYGHEHRGTAYHPAP